MPFIPHTETDVSTMLAAIGAGSIEDLFDEIPPALKTGKLKDVPDGLPEMAVARLMQERAAQDGFWSNFIGAGVYEHHIPAAIWRQARRCKASPGKPRHASPGWAGRTGCCGWCRSC